MKRYELLARIKSDLTRAKPGSIMPVDSMHVLDVLPHFWREDADTIEEWFIKFCRAHGMHATADGQRRFNVRLTRDIKDEATITWPGQRRAPGEQAT
jgi:hypothetical protein